MNEEEEKKIIAEEENPEAKIKDLLSKNLKDMFKKQKKRDILKLKIRAVGRLARVWNIRKDNQTLVLNLKEMCPDGKIPPYTLIEGRKGITDKLKQFLMMKKLDKENEKWHGPRKYTLDQMSRTHKVKGEKKRQQGFDFGNSLNVTDSLKISAALNKGIRRLTLPSKDGLSQDQLMILGALGKEVQRQMKESMPKKKASTLKKSSFLNDITEEQEKQLI